MKRFPFSRSALVLLIACATALFALSVLLSAYGEDPVSFGSKFKPGSYSTSAVGYAGFYDTLRRLGRPVTRSVGNTLASTGTRGTLIIAEPELGYTGNSDGIKLMSVPRLLIVLPKWQGIQDENRPAWVAGVKPVPLILAQQTLGLVLDSRSNVFRKEWPEEWRVNDVGFFPSGTGVVQLIRSEEMRPIVGDGEGMLVGEILKSDRKIWVLSDPDILSNHGIVKGDNALFMLTLVDALRFWKNDDPGAPVVFDETVHGFQKTRISPIKLLFRLPFGVVTILACCTAALLVLAGTSRFGVPRVPKPILDFGKANLIGNSARLLDYAGHHSFVLRRYVGMTIRSVAEVLHAPRNLDEPALAAWLDQIGKTRGVEKSCASIVQTVTYLDTGERRSLHRLFESAWDIHRWKREILK